MATSGGADSAAALLLLRRAAPKARLIACYVDHGIRPKTSIARDIAAVRAQAHAANASVRIRQAVLEPKAAGSPEERARHARYEALAGVASEEGARFVITGHQQDDLTETSLLALARGSGIDGVAAMRPLRALSNGVMLARPLLWANKARCEQLLHDLLVPTSQDETNADTGIPRNAVRALLQKLDRALPGASRGIARSAALLADDKTLLERLSSAAWRRSRVADSDLLSTATLRRMPIALVRRVIRYAVAASGASLRDFSFEHCDAIALAIKAKRGGRFHAGAATVVLSAGKLAVESPHARAPKVFAAVTIDLETLPRDIDTALGHATLALAAKRPSRSAQRLDLRAMKSAGTVEIRLPQHGDACIPSGRSRPISLARFLGKSGVPKSRRGAMPLLCAGGRIAAVLGLRVMEPYKPKEKGPVVEVTWRAADS